ncbi:MAG TPA: hypothetical protein VMZ31_04950 [Phycisphaerae bacterium]|nr:hypothetical protein [Phycisphaerae bacterium]
MSVKTMNGSHRYERWSGRLGGRRWVWPAIVRVGVRLASKRASTRLILLASTGFVVASCAIFYILSILEALGNRPEFNELYGVVQVLLGVDLRGLARMGEHREALWRMVFMIMLKGQLACAMVVIAQVGPGLIANDLRSRALPIYFSKPITPLTYLLGKWAVVAAFIGTVTLLPNLASLMLGTLMTGGLGSWGQTLGLAWDLVVLDVGIMIVGGAVILTLSAANADRRYVTVGWLALCLLPMVAQGVLDDALPSKSTQGFLGSVSPYRDVTVLADWLFDMEAAYEGMALPSGAAKSVLSHSVDPVYPAVVLAAVTLFAAMLCYRRVMRMSRAAATL